MSKKYTPSENEEFMNENMLNYFKQKLLEQKERILSLESHDSLLFDLMDFKKADPMDEAVAEETVELDILVRNKENLELLQIEEALKRIDNKTYGYCKATGEPISLDRLKAYPLALYTIEAMEELEKNERK